MDSQEYMYRQMMYGNNLVPIFVIYVVYLYSFWWGRSICVSDKIVDLSFTYKGVSTFTDKYVHVLPSKINQFLIGNSRPPSAFRTSWLRIPPTTAATLDNSFGPSCSINSSMWRCVQRVDGRPRNKVVRVTTSLNRLRSLEDGFVRPSFNQESSAMGLKAYSGSIDHDLEGGAGTLSAPVEV